MKKEIDNLVALIRQSKEYSELYKSRARLLEDPTQREKLISFQRKNMLLGESNLSPAEIDRHVNESNREYQELLRYPFIGDYFRKLEAYNTLIRGVFDQIYMGTEDVLQLPQ